jgi:transposase
MLQNPMDDGFKFSESDLSIGKAYEYGGSFGLLAFARKIGLDKIIFSKKTQWREDVLAMIIGRLLYQGSKLSLVNTYNDTALWENAGHEFGVRPDVETNCYHPMDELFKRKDKIERKLADKHLKNGSLILYDITNTWLEGEYKNSLIVEHGLGKGGKRGYKQISIGLLTNKEGCPVGIEIFKGNTSDQTTVIDQLEKISIKYGIEEAIFVGDRGMLTQKRIDEIDSNKYKTITALTHKQIENIIDKENIQIDLFDEMNITEIVDSTNNEVKYMLCKNEKEKLKERNTRESLINKVETLLIKKTNVKQKRNTKNTCASVGRIFEKYKIEKFFTWDVDVNGKLTWSRNLDKIDKESALDGCYVIRSNAENINKENAVDSYRRLQKVEQAFRNMKTILLELRPIHHKTDNRIKAHVFIVMLAYYLQWNIKEKLKPLFLKNRKGNNREFTIDIIIKRLMSIVKVEHLLDGIVIKKSISTPDEGQMEILNLLGIEV